MASKSMDINLLHSEISKCINKIKQMGMDDDNLIETITNILESNQCNIDLRDTNNMNNGMDIIQNVFKLIVGDLINKYETTKNICKNNNIKLRNGIEKLYKYQKDTYNRNSHHIKNALHEIQSIKHIHSESINKQNLCEYLKQYGWIKDVFSTQNNHKTSLYLTQFLTYIFISINTNNETIHLNGISKNWLLLFKYLMDYNIFKCELNDYNIVKNNDGSFNAIFSLNKSYICGKNIEILNIEIANGKNNNTTISNGNNNNACVCLKIETILNIKKNNELNYIYFMQYNKKGKDINKWNIEELTDEILLSINNIQIFGLIVVNQPLIKNKSNSKSIGEYMRYWSKQTRKAKTNKKSKKQNKRKKSNEETEIKKRFKNNNGMAVNSIMIDINKIDTIGRNRNNFNWKRLPIQDRSNYWKFQHKSNGIEHEYD